MIDVFMSDETWRDFEKVATEWIKPKIVGLTIQLNDVVKYGSLDDNAQWMRIDMPEFGLQIAAIKMVPNNVKDGVAMMLELADMDSSGNPQRPKRHLVLENFRGFICQ